MDTAPIMQFSAFTICSPVLNRPTTSLNYYPRNDFNCNKVKNLSFIRWVHSAGCHQCTGSSGPPSSSVADALEVSYILVCAIYLNSSEKASQDYHGNHF